MVKVRFNNKTYNGKVTGLLNDYPQVSIKFNSQWISWEFSKQAIARAMKLNTALIV